MPAPPRGSCLREQIGDPDRDLQDSVPQPLGLGATKKKMLKKIKIRKSVSYLLYCQAAVRLAGITIPEKQSGKDSTVDIVGCGRDLVACCGLGQVVTGMRLLLACEGKENICKCFVFLLNPFQEGNILNIVKN